MRRLDAKQKKVAPDHSDGMGGSGALRAKAEERMKDQPAPVPASTPELTEHQVHELRVHQIELEMQNEELRRTQQELEAERARYFDLYDLAPVGYLTLDEKGVILESNLTAAAMFGVGRASLAPHTLSRFILAEDREIFHQHQRKLFESGLPQAFDLRMVRDGAPFHVHLQATLRPDKTGRPRCRIAMSEITALKRAEDELRQNDRRLEILLKLSQHRSASVKDLLDFVLDEAIALTDSKIGYIYHYDETREEFTLNTWSREVMKDCSIRDRQTVYQLRHTGIWGEAVRQRKPIMVNDYAAPDPLKKGYPAGHSPLYRFLTIPVFQDGRIVGVAAVANKEAPYTPADINQLTLLMDAAWRISGRKEAEEALRVNEELYRLLFENMLDGFAHCRMIFDAENHPKDFIYLTVNKAFERITGLKNVVGRRVTEVIPGIREQNPELFEIYGRVALTGRSERFEIYVKPLTIWFSVSVYSTAKGYFVAVFDDITLRKNAKDALQELNDTLERRARELSVTNQDLEAFSYSISHDLRNPLSAIAVNAEVLSMELGAVGGKEAGESLRHIIASADRMKEIINDLMMLSGISRQEIHCRPVDISVMANAFLEELRSSTPNRRALIEVQPNLVARADGGLLQILMENLLRNAWKFSSQREETRISFGAEDREGERFYFIRDNGAGFDMRDSKRLFKPFQRLHAQQHFRGTGIGLAIAKKIVDRHGGRIMAEGEKDKGAVFYFSLACA